MRTEQTCEQSNETCDELDQDLDPFATDFRASNRQKMPPRVNQIFSLGLVILSLFLLSGCFTVTDEFVLNRDGSGALAFTIVAPSSNVDQIAPAWQGGRYSRRKGNSNNNYSLQQVTGFQRLSDITSNVGEYTFGKSETGRGFTARRSIFPAEHLRLNYDEDNPPKDIDRSTWKSMLSNAKYIVKITVQGQIINARPVTVAGRTYYPEIESGVATWTLKWSEIMANIKRGVPVDLMVTYE